MTKWLSLCSASAAQSFAGLDPRRRHGTTHQAMLRRRPTCTGGLWGKEEETKTKQRLATDVSSVANL